MFAHWSVNLLPHRFNENLLSELLVLLLKFGLVYMMVDIIIDY